MFTAEHDCFELNYNNIYTADTNAHLSTCIPRKLILNMQEAVANAFAATLYLCMKCNAWNIQKIQNTSTEN